jgi:hypothetical protein
MSNPTQSQATPDASAIADAVPPTWPWLLAGWFSAAVLLVPWSPDMPGDFADGEWEWALTEAWLRGAVWGRDIVYTYGPWSMFGRSMYHPRTFPLLIAFGVALSLTFAAVFWRVFGPTCRRGWAWLLALLALLAFTPSLEVAAFTLIFLVGMLCWKVEQASAQRAGAGIRLQRADRAVLYASALMLSLVSHTKATWALVSLLVILVFTINHAFVHRAVYRPLPVFLGGWLVFWVLAGQPLSAIPDHLYYTASTISTYTEAMIFPGPLMQVGLFVLCALLLLAGVAVQLWDSRRSGGVPFFAILLIQLLTIFKASYVRHDGSHASIGAWIVLGWTALFLLWVCRARPRRAAIIFGVAAVVSLTLMQQTAGIFPIETPPAHFSRLPAMTWNRLRAMSRLAVGGADLERRWHEGVALAAAKNPLPPTPGTVDVYPNAVLLPLANQLEYRARPVPQSFQATSPALVALNADSLLKPEAPRFLILEVLSFDWCLPSARDSLSWPLFLERYEVTGRAGPRLVLSRSAQPRAWRSTQIVKQRVRLDEKISLPPLPPGSFYWARIELKTSVMGAAANALYKTPMLALHFETEDGKASDFRIIRQLAGGLIVGPLLVDADDYLRLSAGEAALPSRSLVTMTLKGFGRTSPYWAYEPDYELTLWRQDPDQPVGDLRR